MKVIQCWDDGLVSDLRLIEILSRYRAKATFCLNPGLYREERSFGWISEGREVWRLSIHELSTVYEKFEICSHSMTHPCLTDLSGEALDWEIKASRDLLEEIFRKPILGFCYPFNAYNNEVIRSVRCAGYRWARGGQSEERIYPPTDPFRFNPHCHFLDPEFRQKYDRAKENEEVFFFWGHSYELTSETMWEDFEKRIDGISSDMATEWAFVNDLFI